ncbi:MAG: hypothetical protein ABSG46_05270, partial [Candidatus Binataceae bacterium]
MLIHNDHFIRPLFDGAECKPQALFLVKGIDDDGNSWHVWLSAFRLLAGSREDGGEVANAPRVLGKTHAVKKFGTEKVPRLQPRNAKERLHGASAIAAVHLMCHL